MCAVTVESEREVGKEEISGQNLVSLSRCLLKGETREGEEKDLSRIFEKLRGLKFLLLFLLLFSFIHKTVSSTCAFLSFQIHFLFLSLSSAYFPVQLDKLETFSSSPLCVILSNDNRRHKTNSSLSDRHMFVKQCQEETRERKG